MTFNFLVTLDLKVCTVNLPKQTTRNRVGREMGSRKLSSKHLSLTEKNERHLEDKGMYMSDLVL